MNKKLERYLKEQENDKIKSYQKYLMEHGVYERKSEEGEENAYRVRNENGEVMYVNPIDISIEDVEKIENYVNIETTSNNDRGNGVAAAINVIAVLIYIVGAMCGCVVGGEAESWGVAFIYWCAFAVSGTIMLGFSEIINLLHKINLK